MAYDRSCAYPSARKLAEPSRDLFFYRPAQGALPNDFQSVAEIEDRLLRFQEHYEQIAQPFQWTFTRQNLLKLMAKLRSYEDRGLAA